MHNYIAFQLPYALSHIHNYTTSSKIIQTFRDPIELNLSFDVEGDKAWIVTGEFELFGEIREFFYVISDQTGEVAYTFDELGNRDPHIERPMPKEWEDYVDEDDH